MSDLILPEHMAKARRKEKAKIAEKGKTAAEIEQKQKEVEDIYGERESKYIDPDNIDTSVAEKLPKPTGWRILILPYMGAEKSKGGIILADQTREREQLATNGICPEAKKESGMTDKEIVKSIQSNPPCPEAITTMAVTALEKKIEEHNNLKASSQTLH